MPSTALALDEFDEVPVSSLEVLEANVAALRDGLNDFKTEVRTALVSLSGEIRSLREDVGSEFKSLRQEVGSEFKSLRQEVGSEIKSLRQEVGSEIKSLRQEVGSEIKLLRQEVGSEVKSLRERDDRNFERLSTKIEATNQEVSQLSKSVIRVESKLDTLRWIWVGVGGLAGVFLVMETLNKFFHWY